MNLTAELLESSHQADLRREARARRLGPWWTDAGAWFSESWHHPTLRNILRLSPRDERWEGDER